MTTTPSPIASLLLGAGDGDEVWGRLAFALGQTRIGVAVWDADDRLVLANARFREMFAEVAPFDGKLRFDVLLERARQARGSAARPDPVGHDSRHRERPATGEFLSFGNRTLRYHDIATPDGGLVTLYEDVTRERSAEATLAALAKTIPGAIFELRRDSLDRIECTYVSERIRELTGLAPERYTADWGEAVREITGVAECAGLEDSLRASARSLEDWHAKLPIRHPEAGQRWLRAQASPRRLEDGTVLWSGMVTDATETVQSNAALAESERRFRDIIDIASDWVWESDADGRITFVSERFTESTGLPTAAFVGRTRAELPFYDRSDPGFHALEEDTRNRRPIHGRRVRFVVPSGHRQISLRGRPVFDEDGDFLGYRGTGTDVTREHEYVQRLHEAMVEAQSANRAKSRFLANMSHDLRTPLNAIMGFSEIMQAEVFGPVGHPRYAEYVRDVRTSASHLLELIDDLLDLARIESGRIEMVEERLVIADIVDEAMMLVAPRCEARGVVLAKTCDIEAPVVRSDRRAVKQILVNLLTNAAKFTERGGSIEVAVEPDRSGGVWVTVRDDGCGIPPAMIDEVTKPFVQGSDPSAAPRDGVGLGLAIVRSLAEAIGAEIRIESQVGEGTSVAFRLPAGRAARAA
ncbi:sensor histidine kinase [Thalassobaculum fulvum]|uniref:sensor histidine kinase n=1 Tax=Thalassobaculum fulvum TaxID=1633335 RepID=UPI00167455D3|nr:ATP-binding protein [Thalassobaculum fulvum]